MIKRVEEVRAKLRVESVVNPVVLDHRHIQRHNAILPRVSNLRRQSANVGSSHRLIPADAIELRNVGEGVPARAVSGTPWQLPVLEIAARPPGTLWNERTVDLPSPAPDASGAASRGTAGIPQRIAECPADRRRG